MENAEWLKVISEKKEVEDPMLHEVQNAGLVMQQCNLGSEMAYHHEYGANLEEIETTSGTSQVYKESTNEEAEKGVVEMHSDQGQLESHMEEDTQPFISMITKKAPQPIFHTPTWKIATREGDLVEEMKKVKRSARLAERRKVTGDKNSEELAQEVLAKKLGAISPRSEKKGGNKGKAHEDF